MIELTENQRQELNEREPEVIDPETKECYILVRKAVYERLRGLLSEDVRATGELLDRIMATDDAQDPWLASYQTMTRKEVG